MTLKNILCIRPDNMGDLLMSSPAISALKSTFQCKITVLTSVMGAVIVSSIPDIDDYIVFDAPWVKATGTDHFEKLVQQLKEQHFDAAVIFTVFSQNPLPAALLAYLADIPHRIAYCRENPYHLLTHWVPDAEPYSFVQHQVTRDLELVAAIGATTTNRQLRLKIEEERWTRVQEQLKQAGVNIERPWILLHPEVSEEKRQYPLEDWITAAKQLSTVTGYQLLVTGKEPRTGNEQDHHTLARAASAISLSGLLDLESFIVLIKHSALLISVNTGPVHLAAAAGTPVLVLYAMTNPQHTPWMTPHKVLYFDVPQHLRSRNEVVKYATQLMEAQQLPKATTENIVHNALVLLGGLQ